MRIDLLDVILNRTRRHWYGTGSGSDRAPIETHSQQGARSLPLPVPYRRVSQCCLVRFREWRARLVQYRASKQAADSFQDRMGYFWKEEMVNEQLKDIMVAGFNDVVKYAENHGVNNRIAACMLAVDRVAYITRVRGIYA